MRDKTTVAEELIRWHFEVEPALVRVLRVLGPNEDDPDEPIKLIEVNTATLATGHFEAYGFAPTRDVPFRTLIAEVTPDELARWRAESSLPKGWDVDGARHYERPAA